MLKRIIPIIFLSIAILTQAQELKVVKFEANPLDIIPATDQRLDANGEICGLVKVALPVGGVVFDGEVVGDFPFNINTYSVYLAPGSRFLQIDCPGHMPLRIDFRDYGIKGIESKTTYNLVLQASNAGGGGLGTTDTDQKYNYLVMTVEPSNNVTVKIDGRPVSVKNGQVMEYLKTGKHSYIVAAPGYASTTETFEIVADTKTQRKVSLKSEMGHITITTGTPGTEIYLNGALLDNDKWEGNLTPGVYTVEGQCVGHKPYATEISVVKNKSINYVIPTLDVVSGAVDVQYRPIGSRIILDGNFVGYTPMVLSDIAVGQHRIAISSAGHKTYDTTVDIKEGQRLTINGDLVAVDDSGSDIDYKSGASRKVKVGKTTIELVYVEGGQFMMGVHGNQDRDNDRLAKPLHEVTVDNYYIGSTEVTQKLWSEVMGTNPSIIKGGNLPVNNVSWADCAEFIKRLNSLTQLNFRLPTEAEWEYAARGGSLSQGYIFSGSDDIDKVGWHEGNSKKTCHKVGELKPNELGIYDMSGNVGEWCLDWFEMDYYTRSPRKNPKGAESSFNKVFRGGSWDITGRRARTSTRMSSTPSEALYDVGLRLVLDLDNNNQAMAVIDTPKKNTRTTNGSASTAQTPSTGSNHNSSNVSMDKSSKDLVPMNSPSDNTKAKSDKSKKIDGKNLAKTEGADIDTPFTYSGSSKSKGKMPNYQEIERNLNDREMYDDVIRYLKRMRDEGVIQQTSRIYDINNAPADAYIVFFDSSFLVKAVLRPQNKGVRHNIRDNEPADLNELKSFSAFWFK